MATQIEVKQYLAYWFQLGKKVVTDNGQVTYQVKTVIEGDHFSPEFEQCWSDLLKDKNHTCHLEGTNETIADLLSSEWELVNCARCDMPVAMPEIEINAHPCPCNDFPSWPNNELPQPRLPINSAKHLDDLHQRMTAKLAAE